jgi:putative DNA primase/helicase
MSAHVPNPGQLSITNRGVLLRPPVGTMRPTATIAKPIKVLALVTVEGTTIKFVDIGFIDCTGQRVKVTMSPSEFADFRRFRATLLDHGYAFPGEAGLAQRLHAELVAQPPLMRRHMLHRQGWYQKCFVFAGEPVSLGNQILSFEPAHPDHARNFGYGGTLPDWKEGVAKYARYSTRLTLSISLALGAALMNFSDVESGGIHLTGDSGVGKTTCLLCAASVGGKAVRNDLYSWDITKTGLEELAAAHNHMLLCLDEIQRASDTAGRAKEVRDAVYRVAGGSGRTRSAIYGVKVGTRTISWRLFFLSTGETSLNEVARIDSLNRLKGELVRATDLPAQVHEQYGIFESLPPGCTESIMLVEKIEAECLSNYGVAQRELVKRVGEDAETISAEIAAEMQRFLDGVRVPKEKWEHRFAKRFALAYAAAILAIKYDIVPWDAKMVARAIKTCYLAARATVPDADKLRTAGLMRLRERLSDGATIVELVRSGHKVQWSTEQISEAEIFRRSGPKGAHYLVLSDTFIGWFDSPLQVDLVINELDRLELLIKDPNVRTLQVLIKGISGRRRYYAIRETVLNLS